MSARLQWPTFDRSITGLAKISYTLRRVLAREARHEKADMGSNRASERVSKTLNIFAGSHGK